MPDNAEPPIREFADRGTLWLLESPENLRGLLRLVAKDIADKLDFTRAERVNRSFIPEDLQKQEADLLYRIPFRDGRGEALVYLLLEHQSRPDLTMGLRLLSYMVEIWQAQVRAWKDARVPRSQWRLHPIIPLVFYTGRRKWRSDIGLAAMMEVPTALRTFLPTWETLFLKLRETPAEVLANAGTAVAWVLRALQASDEP